MKSRATWYYICRQCKTMIAVSFEAYASSHREKRGRIKKTPTSSSLARCWPCEVKAVMGREWQGKQAPNPATIHALLRVKQTIDQMKAIDQSTLTEQDRHALQECLAHSYDQAAAFLAYSGQSRPGLIPVCLIISIILAVISGQP